HFGRRGPRPARILIAEGIGDERLAAKRCFSCAPRGRFVPVVASGEVEDQFSEGPVRRCRVATRHRIGIAPALPPRAPRRAASSPLDRRGEESGLSWLRIGSLVMIRSSRLKVVWAPLAALVVLLALACGGAQAQVKPFKISGAGVGPLGLPLPGQDPRPHWAV